MTLAELEEEIAVLVNDSSLAAFYRRWINEAVLSIAEDLALPALKLQEPYAMTTTEADWLYDMPADFHKTLFRAGYFEGGVLTAENYVPLTLAKGGFETLHDLDPGHTATDTHPWQIAVQDKTLGIYPKAADTVYLWYYKLPTTLSRPNDIPTCIPSSYHGKVIVPKVVIKNFRILQDMIVAAPHQSIQYWQAELSSGLYGSRGGDVGLVNIIARENPPKRHGGRDPIWTGWGGR